MREFGYTDAELLSYFALFSLSEYLSNLPRLIIKKEDARKKSANYVKALEASILSASSLTEAQDATRLAVAQAYTDTLDISKEEAEELNKRLGEARRLVEEGEIKIRATEAEKAARTSGFNERGATLKALKDEVQDIVKVVLDNDTDKDLRTSGLSTIIFNELKTRHPKEGRSQYFPGEVTIKKWVRAATDNDDYRYTQKRGAPKK